MPLNFLIHSKSICIRLFKYSYLLIQIILKETLHTDLTKYITLHFTCKNIALFGQNLSININLFENQLALCIIYFLLIGNSMKTSLRYPVRSSEQKLMHITTQNWQYVIFDPKKKFEVYNSRDTKNNLEFYQNTTSGGDCACNNRFLKE